MKFLRVERNVAFIILAVAFVSLLLANSPAREMFSSLQTIEMPIGSLGIELDLKGWVDDFLLVGFFFLVGLELKHETTEGALKRPIRLIVPSLAAICGVAAPALTYLWLTAGNPSLQAGWPIPTATDLTFALAVFLIFGSKMPRSSRAFLLAFAIIDDVLAIAIIAVLYAENLDLASLGIAVLFGLAFWFAAKVDSPTWSLIVIGLLVWYFTLMGGIHPTVAGVVLALLLPSKRVSQVQTVIHPWVGGLVLPVFAFFAAAIDLSGIGVAAASPVFLAIMIRPIAKIFGITAGACLGMLLLGKKRDRTMKALDYLVVSTMGGIGFTVALLVTTLTFAERSLEKSAASIATLGSALISTVIAIVALKLRTRARTQKLVSAQSA